jgi:uncharacterized protein
VKARRQVMEENTRLVGPLALAIVLTACGASSMPATTPSSTGQHEPAKGDANMGRFTWHELSTGDTAAAAEFYGSLFGWTSRETGTGPAGSYRMFLKGDRRVGAAKISAPGEPSHWLAYVSTDSVDVSMSKMTGLGAKVLVAPTTVPGTVRFAVSVDPQGARIGIVQDVGGKTPEPVSDIAPEPGTFCWDELMTRDLDAAAKYYAAVFGWTGKFGERDEGPVRYWHWFHAGMDIGGMLALPMPDTSPSWLPYVEVSDVDASAARVRALGGKVVTPAMDIPRVGRFAIVQDPAGATFALFSSAGR